MKTALTPWFDGHVKPVHKGVYQQMQIAMNEVGYQRWDGNQWFGWGATPDEAAKSTIPAHPVFQDDRWRGLASNPALQQE